MAVNKVVYGDQTLVDLTKDTVVEDALIKGISAHSKTGMVVNGTLIVQRYFTGSTVPTSAIGQDGDVYLKVGS